MTKTNATKPQFAGFASIKSNDIESLRDALVSVRSYSGITRSELLRYLEDPYSSVTELQNLSNIQKLTNGLLKEVINYKSNCLTYDHYIFPTDMTKYKDKESLLKDEIKVATQLDKYHLKVNIPNIVDEILTTGEIYLYKRQNSAGVILQKLAPSLCKTIKIDEYGISRVGISLDKITEDSLNYYPPEIQSAYTKNDKGQKVKMLDEDGFLHLSDNAVSFKLDLFSDKGLPYYITMFNQLLDLEDAMTTDNISNTINNYILLKNKIPTDPKTGRLLMDEGVAKRYHDVLKSIVPKGVGVNTSPLELSTEKIGEKSANDYLYLQKIKDGIYDLAGVSDSLFNGDVRTKEMTVLSQWVDALLPLKILEIVNIWLNYELSKFNKKGKWHVSFIKTTYYSRQDEISNGKELITIYYPRKKYLANLGLEPLEVANILAYESLLDIDSGMKPLVTAHTLSQGNLPNTEENGVDDETDNKDTE